MDASRAAFLNAVSANLLDYDDTHLETIIHPTARVAAALLALAEARGDSGREVLTAFILGVVQPYGVSAGSRDHAAESTRRVG